LAARVFFSSRRLHTRSDRDWSSDVCSSDLVIKIVLFSMFITFSFRIIVSYIGYYASLGREDTSEAKDFGSTPLRLLEAAPQCRQIGRASCRESVKAFVVGILT